MKRVIMLNRNEEKAKICGEKEELENDTMITLSVFRRISNFHCGVTSK
jgi:hypothetical protein